jgi:hypothetical protein
MGKQAVFGIRPAEGPVVFGRPTVWFGVESPGVGARVGRTAMAGRAWGSLED